MDRTTTGTPDQQIRASFRSSFDLLNQALDGTAYDEHLRFLNFGYVALPDDPPPTLRLSPAYPNRESAWLLGELARDVDLTGARVADVGCGRGGNAALLLDRLGVEHVAALDLSMGNLAFCQRQLADRSGHPVQADAEHLPLASSSVDAVLNVESAGCYPDLPAFHDEVRRVLRPEGWFLYADVVRAEVLPVVLEHLEAIGLTARRTRDITANVLEARARRAARQRRSLPDDAGLPLDEWVGAPGSELGELLESRACTYVLVQAQASTAPTDPTGPVGVDPDAQVAIRESARAFARMLGPTG